MYVVVPPGGELTICPAPVNASAINKAVGEPGFGLVRLYTSPTLYAFVNDDGHVKTPPLERNPVGAAVLMQLGANPHAYCGPIVITGWDTHAESEAVDMGMHELAEVVTAFWHARRAQLGVDQRPLFQGLADYMRFVVDSPAPQTTVLFP